MAAVVQFGGKAGSRGSQLDSALKEFLDAVVIPALVKEYLSEHERENRLALVPECVTESGPTPSGSAEGVP
jgi:hypothetical protein